MPIGKVKWFDPKKGYGFILDDQGQDVFVHYSSIQGDGFRALKDGEVVAYELVRGEKGQQARNVFRQKDVAVVPSAGDSAQPGSVEAPS